jgi:UDP-N-acetylmuramoylalanine--D-glutamate ligase
MNGLTYLVAGLGKTGLSMARYLHRRKLPFALYDSRENPPGLNAFVEEFPGVICYFVTIPSAFINQCTAILTSPGIPLELPLFREAQDQNIPIYGDIECLAREIQAPVIAITGTNGKSTVTALVGEMAIAAGFNVAVAGNIGDPVLDKLDDHHSYDLWVLELSSFQLALTKSLAPIAATILNITPDHLDRHHTMEEYISAKQSIYHKAKTVVYNRQDKNTYPQQKQGVAISYGEDEPISKQWGLIKEGSATYLAQGTTAFLPVTDLRIKGVHNWQNALAACALADLAGIRRDYQISVLRQFSGLAHRCQWVRSLNEVDWINDSKGTNIGATISAIDGIGGSMPGKIVLIAGGQGKGANFEDLRESVKVFVRSMILIGEDADKITAALSDLVPITQAKSLDEAVKQGYLQAQKGDVVLLSPACASLDMFKDFNHRGEVFTALVQAL